MFPKSLILVSLLIMSATASASASDSQQQQLSRVGFVIMSQSHERHARIADDSSRKLIEDLRESGIQDPVVFVTHRDFPIFGAWTYFPLLPHLVERTSSKIKWFVFLEEDTNVDVKIFKKMMSNYSPQYETFIGHALTDAGPSIVHRFVSSNVAYPDPAAGIILSRNLVQHLAERLELERAQTVFGNMFLKEYTMAAAYELTVAILKIDGATGVLLQHEPQLCQAVGASCATHPRDVMCSTSIEASRRLQQETLFAVKTWSDNHEDRLPLLQQTWPTVTPHILYVSNLADAKFGTVVLAGGENNIDRGHCFKTQAILKHFAGLEKFRWLVIVDDDTLLSVAKLLELLQCYDDYDDDYIAIGEAYGFRLTRRLGQVKFDYLIESNSNGGFDYPTGGGGMVFNRKVAEKMVSTESCSCPSEVHHDDVHLGSCLDNLGIPIIRSERFHQARPENYNSTMLLRQDPISFHKFTGTNPLKIYDDWFRLPDKELRKFMNTRNQEL